MKAGVLFILFFSGVVSVFADGPREKASRDVAMAKLELQLDEGEAKVVTEWAV